MVRCVSSLLLALAATYAIRRAGKQPARSRNHFLWSVAAVSFVLALLFAAPLAFASLRFLMPGLFGAFWFLSKVVIYVYFSTALRFALPHLRFGQSMQVSWHSLIPLTIVNLFSVAITLVVISEYHWNRWLAVFFTTIITLTAAFFLYYWRRHRTEAGVTGPTPAIATDSHAG